MIISNDRNDRLRLDEYTHVQKPFLDQLATMNWKVLDLDRRSQTPDKSFRQHFGQVVLEPILADRLKKINGFLEPDQIVEVVRKITTFNASGLLENNQQVMDYLLENTTVASNRQTGEQSPTVRFIDFEHPHNNHFHAISEFKLRIPGTDHHIIPDIVLFINGLPIGVVECKSTKVKDAMAEAIDQMMRYSQQRGYAGEGCPELFYYNQFMVATCRNEAKFGTISGHTEKYYFRWADPYPRTVEELQHGATSPNDQQRLIAGMCDHRNLLDLIRSCTIYKPDDRGRTIKVMARYQQFRAVKKCIDRLINGQNRAQRSGIVWHTQGSGKSLTMMFLVREMRHHLPLLGWKVVFVTDRTKLQRQLSETSQSIGFNVDVATSIRRLKELIAHDGPGLVMGMIHKFQERDLHEIFPELNSSDRILIMVDEAHRAQYSLLGANLDRAMPNATLFGFTGTPTDRAEQRFRDYIDKYTMRQSNEDGVTLEIVYEGRTHNAEVPDHEGMDLRFEDVFSDYNLVERMQILGYGSRDAYLEAKETIAEKARDMLNHYIDHIFPNKFKAQVVACSRVAAVRYKQAIELALADLIAQLEHDNPANVDIDVLKDLEVAVVISGQHNDKPDLAAFTNSNDHDQWIDRYKRQFGKDPYNNEIDGNIGFLIVNHMLLTGFDAPIEQVLYLDRVITDHNLLQAVARVNRVAGDEKDVGFVVDYVGVGHHMKRAIDAYDEREQREILDCLSDPDQELNALKQAHENIWEFLNQHNCTDFSDSDAFFDLFYDEDIRFEYIVLFKRLSKAFNIVLPRKEALDFLKDYVNFVEINVLAQRHLHDQRLSMKGIPAKLRLITDEFLASRGIDQSIAPISIMHEDFEKDVKKRTRPKTQAAEIEHAIRHYINVNMDEDPELFASFAEAIDQIFREFRDNWRQIAIELEKLRQKIRQRETENTYGLDRKRQMPIFRIFKKALFDEQNMDEDQIASVVNLTQHLTNILSRELRLAGFWSTTPAQNRLKADLKQLILSEEFVSLPGMYENREAIVSRIMEFAKANTKRFTQD